MTRQWLKLDAELFGKPLTDAIVDQFGAAGVLAFIAFLCACKRSPAQGQISFLSEAEAVSILGLNGIPLVDNTGREWTIEEFFTYTGRAKQTRRTSRGRVQNVRCTHWEQWQSANDTSQERERKRRYRANLSRTSPAVSRGTVPRMSRPENEIEKETEIPPPTSSRDTTATTGAHRPADGPAAAAAGRRDDASPRGNGNGHPPTPPVELIDATLDVLAKIKLGKEQALAKAGQRAPIRNTKGWLAKATAELRAADGNGLRTAWLLSGTDDPEALAAAHLEVTQARAQAGVEATKALLGAEKQILAEPAVGPGAAAELKRALPDKPEFPKRRRGRAE